MKMVNAELYFQRKHSLIGEGRPVTLGGIEHRTEVYETENGRRHLCFLKGSERPTSYSSRLGVFVDPRDSSVSLLGMIVNDKLRGSGAGKAIAQYFLEMRTTRDLIRLTLLLFESLLSRSHLQEPASPQKKVGCSLDSCLNLVLTYQYAHVLLP